MTRTSKLRLLAMASVLAVAALIVTGCKATGGGYIPHGTFYGTQGSYPPTGKKATFGFVWQTNDNNEYLASGSWTDGAVKFRLDGGMVMTWSDGQDGTGFAYGSYVSQNRTYPGSGSLTLCLVDNGEPGPTNGDQLKIDIYSGPYSGYHAEGTLQGGNLQIKQ
jgi:hypothetical protein